jgi:RNA-directed DNA polymerase
MCGRARKTGSFVVRRKTVNKRMRAKLQAIKAEVRKRMHDLLRRTGAWLQTVIRGYFQYHAIPGNTDSLGVFRERLRRLWRHAIRRRGQKHRPNGSRLGKLFDRWLPQPRVLHPYPEQRFDAMHPR